MPTQEVDATLQVHDGTTLVPLVVTGGQAASEEKLEQIRLQVAALITYTDGLEGLIEGLDLTVSGVLLDTGQIETQLTSIFAELLEKLEAGDVTGLATAAHQVTLNGRLPATFQDGGVRTREQEASDRTQFEYDDTGLTAPQIRFMGIAPQGTLDGGTWTVRRLTWQTVSGDDKPVDIQTLVGAWSDRASLPWS